MNQAAVKLLQEWDPFQLGEDNYDTEAADVVAALQGMDDASALAKLIQTVYELSFEQWIPLEECAQMASQLIMLKGEMSCTI